MITIVIRNRSDLGGSGIDLESTQAQLLHTTIANNTGGDGSGIRVGNDFSIPGNVTLINTVISGHTIGISAAEHNTATITSTLWHGNTANWDGAGVINHSDDHHGDPKFAFDGFHLSPGSAAMNKGADAGVTIDVDGDTRPPGSGYDIGADEFTGVPIHEIKLFPPLNLRQR